MADAPDELDDTLFDRLADGELLPQERRRLLARLDSVPDGWRQCALAFLEGQAWRATFRSLVREERMPRSPQAGTTSRAAVPPPAPRSQPAAAGPRPASWRPLSMAAGIMLAFGVGILWPRGVESDREGPPGQQVQALPAEIASPRPPGRPTLADRGQLPATPQPAATSWGGVAHPLAAAPRDNALLLVIGGPGTPPRQLEVPLVKAPPLDQQLGQVMRPVIPETLQRRLERIGYRVESQRRYAPIGQSGPQQLIVPVEDLRIVPVGQPIY
jgi:hypothetical protein